LVKRGAAGVADTAKDYGTILASRTGLNKLPLIGSQRASLIRRKAAVGKQEAYDAARKREIEARTGLGEGGIAGSLITGGEKRVKQDIKAKAAEQRNAEETKELESKIKEQDYTNFEQAVAKHEQSTGNKATLEVKAQIAAGQGLGLAAAAVAADRAKIATTSAEGKEKAVVSGLSLEDTLQQGRQFKENLDHERSELLVDKSFDEQRDTKIKRVDRDLSSGRLSAADAEERKASLRQQYAEAKSDTTKREARKRALDRLPTEKYAALAGKLTNKEIAGAEQRAYAGLDRVRALSQEQKGKQKEGKLTSETERISGVVGDILRAEEGKGRTLVRQREEAKAREEIKELGESHDNSEVLTEISDRHKVIQRLNAKSKTSAGLDAGEKKQLEKATQEQKGFLASALHRGLGNYVGGIIKANDSTYNDIEFSDPENAHLIALAATSGEKHTELDSVEKASKVERVVDKRAKEKAGILNRAIKQGAAEAASKHGQFQFASYSREGVDASGQKVVGLTALQRSGLGKSLAGGTTQLGTGKTGDGSKGREIIEDFIESVIEPNLTIDTSRDARTFFKSKVDASSGEEVFSGAATPASRNAILSLADKSADQIAKMPGSVLNVLSGGTEKKSGFDGSKFVFKDSTQKALFKDVLDKFQKNINDATGPAAKDRSRKGLQKALNLLGVDDATISSYGVGISNIESLPLNRLVP